MKANDINSVKKVVVEFPDNNAILYDETEDTPYSLYYSRTAPAEAPLGYLYIDEDGTLAVQPLLAYKYFALFDGEKTPKEITVEDYPDVVGDIVGYMRTLLEKYITTDARKDVINQFEKEVGKSPLMTLDPEKTPEKWLAELSNAFPECSEYKVQAVSTPEK